MLFRCFGCQRFSGAFFPKRQNAPKKLFRCCGKKLFWCSLGAFAVLRISFVEFGALRRASALRKARRDRSENGMEVRTCTIKASEIQIAKTAASQKLTKKQIEHQHLHFTWCNQKRTDKTHIPNQSMTTRILENHRRAEQHVGTTLFANDSISAVRRACMHVCMYACVHVCMYACLHACLFACLRA